MDAYHVFPQSVLAIIPLIRRCGLCCGDQSLHWMLGGVSSLFCGCHSLVRGRVCSSVLEVKILRFQFSKALLPLSVFSIPKEVSAEASEARVVAVNLCAVHAATSILFRSSPSLHPVLCCVPPGPTVSLALGEVMLWIQESRRLCRHLKLGLPLW